MPKLGIAPKTVPIRLSDEERALVYREVAPNLVLDAKTERVLSEPGPLVLELDLLQWMVLMEALTEAAKRATSLGTARSLLLLRERFDDALRAVLPDGFGTGPAGGGIHMFAVEVPLPGNQADDPWMAIVQDLLSQGWEDDSGPMHLSRDLTAHDVRGVPFVTNCRLLLSSLAERGGAKATAKGNLPRDLVRAVLDQLCDTHDELHYPRVHLKVVNEDDVRCLREARAVCRIARLMRKHRGIFQVTKLGRELLEEDAAGDLYRRLFVTFFRGFNIAWLDGLPELPLVQSCAAVSFALLRVAGEEWRTPKQWAPMLLPPRVPNDLAELGQERWVPSTARLRLLEPLVDFGLLEKRPVPKERLAVPESEYRRLPLFDRFIEFDPEALEVVRGYWERNHGRPAPGRGGNRRYS